MIYQPKQSAQTMDFVNVMDGFSLKLKDKIDCLREDGSLCVFKAV